METFVGDIVRITLVTGIALVGLDLGIKFKKPDGTTGFWNATIDPVDGTAMYYETDEYDLDQFGNWRLQAFVESLTVRGHGKIVELKVHDTLTNREDETTVTPTTLVPTTV